MSDAFLHVPDHHELVFVGPGGTNTWGFGYQPTTEDIALRRRPNDRYCVQLVGDEYEVYDLNTLTRMSLRSGPVSIGLPVFVHKDPDAAIMWALMNL